MFKCKRTDDFDTLFYRAQNDSSPACLGCGLIVGDLAGGGVRAGGRLHVGAMFPLVGWCLASSQPPLSPESPQSDNLICPLWQSTLPAFFQNGAPHPLAWWPPGKPPSSYPFSRLHSPLCGAIGMIRLLFPSLKKWREVGWGGTVPHVFPGYSHGSRPPSTEHLTRHQAKNWQHPPGSCMAPVADNACHVLLRSLLLLFVPTC